MEPNEQKNTSIKERLLARIREDELTMHPKTYFMVKVGILAAVAIAILAISISIFNFISFTLRLNGHDSLLQYGSRGFLLFLGVFPWVLFLADVALIVLLEWLLRQFRFATKIPVLYLLAGIFVATVSVGLLIDRGTTFNDEHLRQADENRLPPPFGNYFEGARRGAAHGNGICRCTITAINGNTLLADDVDEATTTRLTIIVPQNDPRATTTSLSVGDVVFIAGERRGNTIEAFGISKTPFAPPRHQPSQ